MILDSFDHEELIKFCLDMAEQLGINIIDFALERDIISTDDISRYFDRYFDIDIAMFENNDGRIKTDKYNILFGNENIRYNNNNTLYFLINELIDKYNWRLHDSNVIDKLVEFGYITKKEVYELIADQDRENLIKILNDLN